MCIVTNLFGSVGYLDSEIKSQKNKICIYRFGFDKWAINIKGFKPCPKTIQKPERIKNGF